MVHLHFQRDYIKYQTSHVGVYSLALILGSKPPLTIRIIELQPEDLLYWSKECNKR